MYYVYYSYIVCSLRLSDPQCAPRGCSSSAPQMLECLSQKNWVRALAQQSQAQARSKSRQSLNAKATTFKCEFPNISQCCRLFANNSSFRMRNATKLGWRRDRWPFPAISHPRTATVQAILKIVLFKLMIHDCRDRRRKCRNTERERIIFFGGQWPCAFRPKKGETIAKHIVRKSRYNLCDVLRDPYCSRFGVQLCRGSAPLHESHCLQQ